MHNPYGLYFSYTKDSIPFHRAYSQPFWLYVIFIPERMIYMKLPNGYGSVYKLSGKRRKPWIARKTSGWDIDEASEKTKQKYKTIGYFATRQEALTALANYNENPYDLDTNFMTFADVYEKWSNEYFETITPSAVRTVKSAYNYCEPLHKMRMRDIRVNHLEQVIKAAKVGNSTKGRMKSLFNLMYRYAMKHEIVDKDYAALCNPVKREPAKIKRIPFSQDEISTLWNNVDFPFVNMVLIGIYTGFRPQELAILKIADIDFDNKTIKGGLKTDAGRNRLVPIHPLILDLVKKTYNKALELNSEYLFNDENGQQGTYMTYDKYRGRWNKIMTRLNMDHKPHDTRHTFITKAKESNMNEYVIKLIVGHAVRDITEKVYTHRTIEELHMEIEKIKE